jgi:hypothetical protein
VSDDRGVGACSDPNFQTAVGFTPATTIVPANIELQTVATPTLTDYWALFGYNQDQPIDPSTGLPWLPASPTAYTPWPSAIRITMVLHDPQGKLESGREFQFIIDLPKRK